MGLSTKSVGNILVTMSPEESGPAPFSSHLWPSGAPQMRLPLMYRHEAGTMWLKNVGADLSAPEGLVVLGKLWSTLLLGLRHPPNLGHQGVRQAA